MDPAVSVYGKKKKKKPFSEIKLAHAVLVSRSKPKNFHGSRKPQCLLMTTDVEMQPSITR